MAWRAILAALGAAVAAALAGPAACASEGAGAVTLLHVSYDPTRALFDDVNAAFARRWRAERGQDVVVRMSHGGSGKQARAVLEGLEADVVSLALARDVDVLAERGLLGRDWQARLPAQSAPFLSTIVLVVRGGNPKRVRGWDDLVRDDVTVVAPNPKTSGGARWGYLAAWAHGRERAVRDDARDDAARAFVAALYARVPVLDTGARASMTTFAERGIGDVLVAWESEARLLVARDPAAFEIVVPSLSVRAEPPVAVVDAHVDAHGTRAVAQAYVEFLFSDEAQAIAARHHFRPAAAGAAGAAGSVRSLEQHAPIGPARRLVDVAALGGWAEVQRVHFDEGGVFDALYTPRERTR